VKEMERIDNSQSPYPPMTDQPMDLGSYDAQDQYMQQPMQSYPQGDDTASIIRQIDPRNIVRRIELKLRGYQVDEDGDPIEEKKGRALMNDEGINAIMGIADSYVNLNTSLSNNEIEEISEIMVQLIHDMSLLLMVHRNDYGIMYSTDRTRIMQIVIPPIYFVLKRSMKEGDKRFLKGQTIEHINRSFSGSKQGGVLSVLNPFKSKPKEPPYGY